MGWRGVLGMVLLAAAIASGWAVIRQRAPEPQAGPSSGRSAYTLYDFELLVLDDAGKEAFTLRAPELQRLPAGEALELTAPVFLFPAQAGGGARWRMTAREGWVSPGGDEVRLKREVRAEGPGSGGGPATLETDRLTVFPRTDKARTDARVRIVDGRTTIRGRGLEVDLATRRYALLADVESRYVPSR
ncbi:LPS export ABC transporter periplasmic protein LptC [Luteimonas pelagia]